MKVNKDKQVCNNQPLTSSGKKTNAEKCKAYRERKKLNNQLPISMEKKKTAERVKACRQRKKLETNKQDILSSPGDIDPLKFLQVEMDTHQDVGVDSDVVLPPVSPNPEQFQEVPGLFPTCDNLPGAEITPIIVSGDKSNDQIIENTTNNVNLVTVNDEATEQQTTSAGNNVDDRRHKCDICHYKFKRLDHLKRHMKIHPIDEVLVAQVRQQCAREEAAARKKAALEDELRRYTCNVCYYKFKRADHLKRHMTRSHPEELALIAATEELAKARQAARAAKLMGRFEDSEENPDDESAVSEDLKVMHPNDERRFACTLCDFKFKRRDHLNRHMTVHTDQIILPRAENSSDMVGDRTEEENLWLSSMRRFSCTICEAKFKRADHLKRHMIKHSSKPSSSFPSFARSLDGESSTTPDLMEFENSSELVAVDEGSNSNVGNDDTDPSTKIADDEERRFICNVCNFRFKRRFHLMRHMIKHTEDKFVNLGLAREGENEKKSEEVVADNDSQSDTSPGLTRALGQVIFRCNVCDLQFKQPYRLKIHMARHSEERLFACPMCNYRAKLACNLRKHMLTHSDEKPFACHLCNYKGKLACALKDHIMLIHSDDKPYACDVCEFKAKVPSHLKKHMVSHQVETPYQCSVCDFRAKRAGNLKEHMGTHTNEKRFRCKMCSYGTRRQRNLRKHMAVHFDDKPYLCEICPYKAKLPNYLKDHMKTHTDMKPYDCPLCDYKSRQSRQLKRHIQSHAESFGVNSMVLSEMTN